MDCQNVLGRAVSTAALSIVSILGVGLVDSEQATDSLSNLSCIAIAGTVTCYETGYVPIAPIPPGFIPAGPDVEGSDEDIVIRDDGGHHVARG